MISIESIYVNKAVGVLTEGSFKVEVRKTMTTEKGSHIKEYYKKKWDIKIL